MKDPTRQHHRLATGEELEEAPGEAGRSQGYAKGGHVKHGSHGHSHGTPGHDSHGHSHTKKMHRG